MSLPRPRDVHAIVFDYGNTLIEFGQRQIDHCGAALRSAFQDRFGDFDIDRFDALRAQGRLAPYRNGYRENDLRTVTRDLANELFGSRLLDAQIDDLVAIRRAAFVGCIEAEPSTHRVLELLGSRYRLGLLSNYPCGRSIRASLEATGLERHFAAVVVSGDVGFVKPHPLTFETILERLRVPAEHTAFVGDNWLADVQGSKRAGMTCVHMRRWTPPEPFEPQPGDFEPDYVVRKLAELLELFDPDPPPGS